MTAPELLALALGRTGPGACRCFYCGAACGTQWPADVKPTFTDYDAVACQASDYRCAGCDASMRESDETGRIEKFRNYSWIITQGSAVKVSKGGREILRKACIQPPPPPYVLLIAVSGQKHLLFRARVCADSATACACLEGQTIHFHPVALQERLGLTDRIAAAAGRPSLEGPISIPAAIAIAERFGDGADALIETWSAAWSEPLSRLAAYLTPAKEQLQDVYPLPRKGNADDGLFPAGTGGTDRPRAGRHQRR